MVKKPILAPRAPKPRAPKAPAAPPAPVEPVKGPVERCVYGVKCFKAECALKHPKSRLMPCPYAFKCHDETCTLPHAPCREANLAQWKIEQAANAAANAKLKELRVAAAGRRAAFEARRAAEAAIPCRFGVNCTMAWCMHSHPRGRVDADILGKYMFNRDDSRRKYALMMNAIFPDWPQATPSDEAFPVILSFLEVELADVWTEMSAVDRMIASIEREEKELLREQAIREAVEEAARLAAEETAADMKYILPMRAGPVPVPTLYDVDSEDEEEEKVEVLEVAVEKEDWELTYEDMMAAEERVGTGQDVEEEDDLAPTEHDIRKGALNPKMSNGRARRKASALAME